MRSLSNKAIVTNSLGTLTSVVFVIIALAFVLVGGKGTMSASNLPVGLIILGVFVVAFGAVGYSVLWVKLFGYQLEDNEVKIEQGVISKSYDSIPYSRIQNVAIKRNLLQRMLGISTIDIQTAVASRHGESEGNIPGVDKRVAEQVREEIMSKSRNQGDRSGGM